MHGIKPNARIDSLVLAGANATSAYLVHVPPHMSEELRSALQPGTGLPCVARPRHGDVIATVAVTAPNGRTVNNQDPPNGHGHKDKPSPMTDIAI
jgi:hypothetical protein